MADNGFDKENLADVLRSLRERPGRIGGRAQTYESLGLFYRKTGELVRALEMYRRSLEMHKHAEDVRGTVRTLNNLALVYEEKGEWARAKENYEKSLEILERVGHDRGTASVLLNLAVVHLEMGREDEAKLFLGRAYLISSELGLRHADSLLEALEEVCESKKAAEACLAQLTENPTSGGTG